MNKAIQVSVRNDRLGAIFCSMIGDFIYIKNKSYTPVYPKDFVTDSIYLKVLRKFMSENNNNFHIIKKNYGGIRQNQMVPVCELKQDLISYFKQNYFADFMIELSKYTSKYTLPWNGNEKVICIHIRLDDVSYKADYNGVGSAEYISNLINNDTPYNYDREHLLKCSPDHQAPISPKNLYNLVRKMRTRYPNKKFHIVKYGSLNSEYLKIVDEFHIMVHQNEPDYDLWLLINSEILITSKSTYSQVASYFHTGAKIFSPYWGVGVSNGIMSKYNRTNIEFYT